MIPKPFFRKDRKTWYVQIAGVQHNIGKTKKDADANYKRILQTNGLSEGPSRTKLHDLIDEYWAWYEREKSASSIETRRPILQTFRDQTPDMLAEEVRPFHVDKWISRSKAKAADTISGRITLISGMFNWGIRMGLVKANPIANMPRPTPVPREDFVPPKRFKKLIKACDSSQLRDVVTFMLDTGCRVTEVFKLKAEYFDGSRFVLPIDKSKGKRRQRVIYVTETTAAIANRLCKKHSTGAIFRNSRGNPWNKSSMNCAMLRLRPKIGIDNLCATMFRHSFAYNRLSQGQSPEIVAKLMGHVDTTMLMRRYGHLSQARELLESEANKYSMPEDSDGDSNEQGNEAA